MGPRSPTPGQTARATDGGGTPIRILRAVEGEGESVKTEEFEICPPSFIASRDAERFRYPPCFLPSQRFWNR
jgi:hypothetical protein